MVESAVSQTQLSPRTTRPSSTPRSGVPSSMVAQKTLSPSNSGPGAPPTIRTHSENPSHLALQADLGPSQQRCSPARMILESKASPCW